MKKDKSEGASLRSQFKDWLKEICPWKKIEDYCQIMVDSANPEVMKVRIFSHVYRYTIIAKETAGGKTYLGCQVMRRKSLAGETHYKGADLPDGDFKRATWERIKDAILNFEFVKITVRAKKQKWNTLHSYYEQNGKQYYAEWLQCGNEIRDHKAYELVGEKEKGKIGDSELTDVKYTSTDVKATGLKSEKPTMRDSVKKVK